VVPVVVVVVVAQHSVQNVSVAAKHCTAVGAKLLAWTVRVERSTQDAIVVEIQRTESVVVVVLLTPDLVAVGD